MKIKNQNNLQELEEKYDLELSRILKQIRKSKAKIVLLQFPDGLKQWANSIVDYLREKTKNKTEFLIWFGSCYGACDTPVLGKELEKQINLIIQFGHNEIMPSY
jgi:2-(3-amino-3-carboxypropyl)histidine synthase